MRTVAFALVVAASLACRGRPGSAPSAARRGAVPGAARLLVAPLGDVHYVSREPDGFDDVVYGTLRVQVRGEAVRVADEPFVGAIMAVAQVERGWVFVGLDGACASSPNFTGPLTRIGDLSGWHGRMGEHFLRGQRGRIAVVDAQQSVWTSDGGPIVRADPLGPGRFEKAVFATSRHGAAFTSGGSLRCTRDGGASWRDVPADGAVSDLEAERGVLRVWSYRWQRLSLDCELIEREPNVVDDALELDFERLFAWDHARDREERLERLLALADPAWVDLMGGLALPNGTRVVMLGECVRVLDGATGRVLRRSCTEAEEERTLRWCALHTAGHFVGVSCPNDTPHSDNSLGFYLDADLNLLPTGAPSPARLRALPSELADYAVAPGACDEPAPVPTPTEWDAPPSNASAPRRALCEFTPQASLGRTRQLAAPFTELLGIFGRRALLRLSERAIGVVDLSAPRGGATPVTTLASAREGRSLLAAVGLGGVVTVLTREGDDLRAAAVGRLGGPLTAVPLPAGVARALFADTTHGFAWSEARLLRTRDAGRHWELVFADAALESAARGRGWHTDGEDALFREDALRCSRARCCINGRWVVTGWGPVAPGTGLGFAARRNPVGVRAASTTSRERRACGAQ